MPLATRFTLGPAITPVQRAFLDRHGSLLFARVATADEVAMLGAEIARIEAAWLAEGRTRVFGIPLFLGRDQDGRPFIQRLAFLGLSERIRTFVHDPRFRPILDLVGPGARIGDREKDGVGVRDTRTSAPAGSPR